MLKFFVDENVHIAIVRGLRRELPTLDIVRVQELDMQATSDPDVLEWAAQEGRIVITHDVTTMREFADQRVREGKSMPGLIVVPQTMPIGAAMADLAMMAQTIFDGELEGRVEFLPL